jgi:hypothetical protein
MNKQVKSSLLGGIEINASPAPADPSPNTVTWAFLNIAVNASNRAQQEDTPMAEAHRLRYAAFVCGLLGQVLRLSTGECSLHGIVTANELLAGAAYLADCHSGLAQAMQEPDQKDGAEWRALFWRDCIAMLPDVAVEGTHVGLLRIWTMLTANMVTAVFTARMADNLRGGFVNLLIMTSRETSMIAQMATEDEPPAAPPPPSTLVITG